MAAPMKANEDNYLEMIEKIVKHVMQSLMEGKKPPDDTIMHNLFESLKQNVCNPEDVMKLELDAFVTHIVENSEQYDESIVSFAVNMCGWLVDDATFYFRFADKTKKIFSTVSYKINSGEIFETVVQTSLYESLIPMTKHVQGLAWLYEERKDIIFDGLKLLVSSPSIFLEKAIIDFLCAVIVQLECSVKCIPIIDAIQQHLDKLMIQNNSRPFVAAPLKLLDNLCVHYPTFQRELLTTYTETLNTLFSLLVKSGSKNSNAVLSIICAVYREWSRKYADKETCILDNFISKTESTLSNLISNNDIVKAQKLALCCLDMDKDSELYQTCSALLLQPVTCIFGGVSDQIQIPEKTLLTAMETHSLCVTIVSLSLDSDVLPEGIIIRLLKNTLTIEEVSNSSIASNLLNNTKIQRKCLEYLLKMGPPSGTGPCGIREGNSCISLTCRCILDLYKNAECDSLISSLCTQLLTIHLPQLISNKDLSSLTSELADILQRHLSALKWELRDSTLEFLGKVIQNYRADSRIVLWLEQYRFPMLVWLCLRDNESYVRASAVSTLLVITHCAQLYNNLMETASLSEDDVVKEITNIVSTDTEAFARRSAMTFLCQYYKVKVTTLESPFTDTIPRIVIATAVMALRDFDWEVKIAGLDFVEMIFTGPISDQLDSSNLIDSKFSFIIYALCYQNLAGVLFEVLDDYDDAVCEKSLDVFTGVQSYFKTMIKHLGRLSFENKSKKCFQTMECFYRRSRINGNNDTVPTLTSLCKETEQQKKEESSVHSHKCNCDTYDEQCLIETVDKILVTDLSVYKNRLKYSHDKVAKLVSLTEDILSFTTGDGEEKISDCY